jgi:enoyl-CoA hydratase/carnithine racemase
MGAAQRELASGKVVVDEPRPRVARITIHHRAKRGMLDQEILDVLAATVPTMTAQCLVITGDGPYFSAGYDIETLHLPSPLGAADGLTAHPSNAALEAIERYPYPVLAALNGHTFGGGLELAMACDMRVAAGTANFAMTPGKLGIVYSHTGLRRFLDVCGLANTNELFFLATPIGAGHAREMGLLNRVVVAGDFEASILSIAEQIASTAPLALAGHKRAIRTLRAELARLPAFVEQELIELSVAGVGSHDFAEGQRAFVEKRKPTWTGE